MSFCSLFDITSKLLKEEIAVNLHMSRKSGIFLGVIMSTDIHVLSCGLFNSSTTPIFLYSG